MTGTPPYLQPFLLDPPLPAVETVDDVDLYLPAGQAPAPVVVLVHGGPIRPGTVSPREWPGFVGHASLLAEAGVAAVMLEHRFTVETFEDAGAPVDDVRRAIDVARAHPRVDGDRLALWVFSAGGALLAPLLDPAPEGLRAVAATYPYLAGLDEVPVPVLVTRVEHEYDWVDDSVVAWLAGPGSDAETLSVAGAQHGFETVDHTDEARQAVRDAVAWVAGRLHEPSLS